MTEPCIDCPSKVEQVTKALANKWAGKTVPLPVLEMRKLECAPCQNFATFLGFPFCKLCHCFLDLKWSDPDSFCAAGIWNRYGQKTSSLDHSPTHWSGPAVRNVLEGGMHKRDDVTPDRPLAKDNA